MKIRILFLALVVVMIFPSITHADALDEFKNVLMNRHFFIRYFVNADNSSESPKRNTGWFQKSHGEVTVIDDSTFDINRYTSAINAEFVETINDEDFFVEKFIPNPISKYDTSICYWKIGDKLVADLRTLKDGKYKLQSARPIYHYEVGDKKIYGNIYIKQMMDALCGYKDSNSAENVVYNRAGSGTSDDGLTYFDLKADNTVKDSLKAVRYYFDGNSIRKIAIADYAKNSDTGKMEGSHVIIEVKEFNTNPDAEYFTLPKWFKKTKSDGVTQLNGAIFK